MPDLEPVNGDPFATQLEPVSGDPFAGWGEDPQRLLPRNTFAERWPADTTPLPSPLDVPHGKDEVTGWWKYLPKQTQEEIDNARLQHYRDLQYELFRRRGVDSVESDFDPPRYRPSLLQKVSDDSGMTHWPGQPAHPYMHQNVPAAASAITGFAAGGLQGAGVPLPDWAASNPVQRALQNPDNEAALGIARPGMTRSLSAFWSDPNVDARLSQLRAEGKSFSQIAKELGVSREAVGGRIWRLNNPRQQVTTDEWQPPIWSKEKDERVQELLDRGHSYNEVARNLQTTRGAIAGRARVLGLQSRNRPIGIRGSQERQPSLPELKFSLEPVEHDPFAAENERIFGYQDK